MVVAGDQEVGVSWGSGAHVVECGSTEGKGGVEINGVVLAPVH